MHDLLEAREARFGENQSLFRAVNERVESISDNGANRSPVSFLCECANTDCDNQIDLSLDEYEAIRHDSTHFFVLHDHVFPDVEAVVEERASYVIVEKFGQDGRVAAATDERRIAP